MKIERLKPTKTGNVHRRLWLIRVGEEFLSLEKIWSQYSRRFGVDHWYRFAKQRLHWTLPNFRTPTQCQRWSDLTTNLLPQDEKQNEGVWQTQEENLQDLAKLGYEFFIYAGGLSEGGGKVHNFSPVPDKVIQITKDGDLIEKPIPINKGDDDPNQFSKFSATGNTEENIQVPRDLWKVVLGFSPSNTTPYPDIHFAWIVPNNSYNIKKELNYTSNDGVRIENRKWNDQGFYTSIQSLENRLNNNSGDLKG